MANIHVFETKMSDRMQVTRFKVPVWASQASFEERAKLKNGQAVTRPYTDFSRADMGYYTRGTNLSPISVTETNETLTVNTVPAAALPIDDFDEIQSNFALQSTYANKMMKAINSMIDLDYLAEVSNASSYVDAGDVGGSAGSGISLTSSNVLQVYAAALRKLQDKNVNIAGIGDPRVDTQSIKKGNLKPSGSAGFADIDPHFNELLNLAVSGRATQQGDLTGKNGYVNSYFQFDNFITTNGYWVGVLGLATQPTDGDTVVVNGVTYTFKTTLGTTAGNVLIGASADTANTNLAALINDPDTTTAQGVALSAADQKKMKDITATADTTANTLTLVAKGSDYIVVSETLTDTTDGWTSEISHQMFGQKGAVDMIVQKAIGVKVDSIPLQFGVYIKPNALYGKKTFSEGADQLVDVRVDSSSWS